MLRTVRDRMKSFFAWLIMLNDTPHSIAMGVAIGWFIGMTPTVGIQITLVAVTSLFIRLNRTAGCVMVLITNPLTMVPIFFVNYLLGTWILRMEPVHWEFFVSEFEKAFAYDQWYEKLFVMLRALGRLSLELAGPLWLGCVVVGIVGAVPFYFIVRRAVVSYREAHRRRLEAALAREGAAAENTQGEASDGKAL